MATGSLQPLTDLECREIPKQLIDAPPAQHPVTRLRGEYYYDVPRLSRLFQHHETGRPVTGTDHAAIDLYLEELQPGGPIFTSARQAV
ncbi:MAG: hypothetical protein IPJ06_16790 [Saprospiraceae bacterium]|nr:hypothetical protein [Saprospiraceae bacterium]